MDFEAKVRLTRSDPIASATRTIRFEAANWFEADEIVRDEARKGGYSGFPKVEVLEMEKLL